MRSKQLLLLTCLATGSYSELLAQSSLESGYDFVATPGDGPYVYYDLLRNQNPFILHQYRQNLNTNNWISDYRYHTLKDADGRFTKLGTDEWNRSAGAWENQNSYSYTFSINGAGKFSEIVAARQSDVNTNLYDTKEKFHYDANNNIIKIENENAAAGTGNYFSFSTRFMAYDSQNRRILDSTQYDFGMITSTKYFYNGDTLIIGAGHMVIGTTTIVDTSIIRRDTNGRMLGSQLHFYENGKWTSSDSSYYTYDAGGRVLMLNSMFKESDSSIWEPTVKIEHQYDANGHLLGWIRSIQDDNDSSAFIPDYKLEIRYGSDTVADSAFSYFWTGSTFDARAQQRFIFKDPSLSVANLDKGNKPFAVYPNPASDKLYLGTGNPALKEVRIYDISGRLIEYLKTSGNEVDVTALASGFYLISIDGRQTMKFEKR